MRFGIQTGPQHVTWEELLAIWQVADGLQFDSAWTFDHFYPLGPDPRGTQLEGWIALTALAMRTEHVRVGTLVTGVTYREPAVLAKMGATLDVITAGRLNMGLGAAWFELEHNAYGISFPPIAERIRRLGEVCEVITRLWTEKEVNFDGRYYRLTSAWCEPKPVQKPHPPIMIGGGGEQLTLKMVAKSADQWNVYASPEEYRRKLEVLERHCRGLGRDPAAIEKTVAAPLALARDSTEAERRLGELARTRWGAEAEELKPMAIWGFPEQAIQQVEAYRAAGVQHLILSLGAPYNAAELELFAKEVIPAVQQVAA